MKGVCQEMTEEKKHTKIPKRQIIDFTPVKDEAIIKDLVNKYKKNPRFYVDDINDIITTLDLNTTYKEYMDKLDNVDSIGIQVEDLVIDFERAAETTPNFIKGRYYLSQRVPILGNAVVFPKKFMSSSQMPDEEKGMQILTMLTKEFPKAFPHLYSDINKMKQ